MADIVKVKPKKDYDWNQDNKAVYIRINIPNTSINKIEIFLSDLILRVTSLEKKSSNVFDLYDVVNYKSKQNKFVYANNTLSITLIKQKQQMWKQLNISLPVQQLRERRKQSEARYEKTVQQVQEKKQLLRDKFDKKATQQQMRFEQEERNILDKKKITEKNQALKQLYRDINQQGKITKKKQLDWNQKQKIALQLLDKEEQQEKKERQQISKINKTKAIINSISSNPKKSIFTQQEIQNLENIALKNAQEFQEIPIRKAANVPLKFTQKLYPGVATRDTHFKEPPLPKNKSLAKNSNQQFQQRNPLWLKDKGDQFVKNKDYISAINAYTTALKSDDKFITALLNRSFCHMRIFNFDECIRDCEQIQKLMQSMLNEQDSNKSKKIYCKTQLRKAISLSWKGDLEQGRKIFSQLLENFHDILNEEQIVDVKEGIKLIDTRLLSNEKKLLGDIEYKKSNYEKCISAYQQSIHIQKQNEYSISNKALALLKLNKNKQVIEECDKALKIIEQFLQNVLLDVNNKTSSFQSAKLLVKIYLRKGTALKNLGQYRQSQEVIRKACLLDQEDKESKKLLKQIELLINKENIRSIKEEAAKSLKQGKFQEALEKYADALKIIDPTQVLQYLAILQNRCVCFLKLQRFDDIVSTAIRSLKIIHNHQNRIVAFDNVKINKQQKQKLTEFEIRILVRRANAYSELGQIYNAKADLQKALQISPDNQSIKTDLQKIKKILQK